MNVDAMIANLKADDADRALSIKDKETYDGGPAFPFVLQGPKIDGDSQGMSLRDYFAAKAMQGLVARIGKHDTDLIAHDSYVMADAMLSARCK